MTLLIRSVDTPIDRPWPDHFRMKYNGPTSMLVSNVLFFRGHFFYLSITDQQLGPEFVIWFRSHGSKSPPARIVSVRPAWFAIFSFTATNSGLPVFGLCLCSLFALHLCCFANSNRFEMFLGCFGGRAAFTKYLLFILGAFRILSLVFAVAFLIPEPENS